ncbi:hypothetical protein H696_04382 [Fonticula alba]|uniref:DNA polymerase n=1 Tax=Fonticula alba TaxID=691883 RepID=A0A058Z4Z3_FONAL|nr:hypothetical protein H696_04382 [Fonticula alba]KCV68963.1 hypothetical protein H696_04382 [Fonticula alba]|eukprot:XP_009496534.1 hypothetical protein H696_04382 [Fonticula alba]
MRSQTDLAPAESRITTMFAKAAANQPLRATQNGDDLDMDLASLADNIRSEAAGTRDGSSKQQRPGSDTSASFTAFGSGAGYAPSPYLARAQAAADADRRVAAQRAAAIAAATIDSDDEAALLELESEVATAMPMAPAGPSSQPATSQLSGSLPDANRFLRAEPADAPRAAVAPGPASPGWLHFYWLDCIDHAGVIYLCGKIRHGGTDQRPQYQSCSIAVRNVERNLFFLPRTEDGDDGPSYSMEEVEAELADLFARHGIREWSSKPVRRKYGFELEHIPREAEYLKVSYSFTAPTLPADLKGRTFSHVFGADTRIQERFIVKNRLKGPSWLWIYGCEATPAERFVTWSRHEYSLDNPKGIHAGAMAATNTGTAEGPTTGATPSAPNAKVSPRWERHGWPAPPAAANDPPPGPPPLVVVSISLKTLVDRTGRGKEIFGVTLRAHQQVSADAPTPLDGPIASNFDILSVFRRVGQAAVAACPGIVARASEKDLLEFVLEKLVHIDVDVLLGHGLLGSGFGAGPGGSGGTLETLLHRLQATRARDWSRLGRLRRRDWPHTFGKGALSSFYERMLTGGRLLCDTQLAARDALREQSYTLEHLLSSYLDPKGQLGTFFDYVPVPADEAEAYLARAASVWDIHQHSLFEAHLVFMLLFKLSYLPLSRQLTAIAGNLWNNTLAGSRAGRNEYLLLHTFHGLKYIVPDRQGGRGSGSAGPGGRGKKPGRAQAPAPVIFNAEDEVEAVAASLGSLSDGEDNASGDEDARAGGRSKGPGGGTHAAAKRKRGPTYQGGMVLEPKIGLYDTMILVLDFNSLYPSIIQEYNICFTTVDRFSGGASPGTGADGETTTDTKARHALPPVPAEGTPRGILPDILASLIAQRGAVRRQMRRPGLGPVEYDQLNLRQQALKLTANSMYGCLGFAHSRFFARPLAMLITAKGRDVLNQTVQLVEAGQSFTVVYGDTDSLMINTHSHEYAAARRAASDIIREVNKGFRHIELDMDNIFARLLLLRKKKYAALSVVRALEGGPAAANTLAGAGGMPGFETKLEIKGIDMVRRDWCMLTRQLSRDVLDVIFGLDPVARAALRAAGAGDPLAATDAALSFAQRVLDVVRARNADIRAGRVDTAQFVIYKTLVRAPEQYVDARNHPHVMVALRQRARGISQRANDVIPYVICTPESVDMLQEASAGAGPAAGGPGPTTAGTGFARYAFHPDEVSLSSGVLQIDFDWYISQQIFPPISRLCAPIGDLHMGQLAECLGLDARRFDPARSAGAGAGAGGGFGSSYFGLASDPVADTLAGLFGSTDADRFSQCPQLFLSCVHCPRVGPFRGVLRFEPIDPAAAAAAAGQRGAAGDLSLASTSATNARFLVRNGFRCGGCLAIFPRAVVFNGVVRAIRRAISQYYEGWNACDECGARGRHVRGAPAVDLSGAAGEARRCRALNGCGGSGTLTPVLSSTDLYNQLHYFDFLFDRARIMEAEKRAHRVSEPGALDMTELYELDEPDTIELIRSVQAEVRRYLELNALGYVDMGSLFGAMGAMS